LKLASVVCLAASLVGFRGVQEAKYSTLSSSNNGKGGPRGEAKKGWLLKNLIIFQILN